MRLSFLFCLLSPTVAWCQKPVISSVVNAASYQPANGVGIVSVFGTNLAAGTETAGTASLPTQIAGTSVTVFGQPAHLFYVSPGQINLQLPTRSSYPATPAGIVVTTASGTSDPYMLTDAVPFGIFTIDSSGCGQGAVLNNNAGGSLSVNSPSNSVSPGGYISIFGTGGLFIPTYTPGYPQDGMPAPSSPLVATQCSLSILDWKYQVTSEPTSCWAGLAPGLVGVDQINVKIPDTMREGCAVPLLVRPYGSELVSQPVTISIRKGGGQCLDPPSAGYGQITWERAITTAASGSTSEDDTMTVSLQTSPGKQPPPVPLYSVGGGYYQTSYFGPPCSVPAYRSLDAGTITARGSGFEPVHSAIVPMPQDQVTAVRQGPGGIYFQQRQISGLKVYRAALPAGTIRPGSFTPGTTGGADVGAFQSGVQIGSGIQVTTPITGKTFPSNQPLTINWTGGDPSTWVTFQLVRHLGTADYNSVVHARASAGTITLGTVGIGINKESLPGPFVANMDIVLEVTPDPSQISAFSAPGLSLGGQHTWKYTYRFEGVTIR